MTMMMKTLQLDQTRVKRPRGKRTKESESFKKPSSTKKILKGKALTKGSKTDKTASAKEPVEEPIVEVVIDDAGDDVARDDNQPQDTSEPKTRKTLNPNWFKQPLRPHTPDHEWNKHQVVLDQPKQPWFNQMVSAIKDPLTFNDLIATPIDFSKQWQLDMRSKELKTWSLHFGVPLNMHITKMLKKESSTGYRSQVSKFSKHNVYSTKAILGVKSVSVKKLHGYGHLEEIMVKRSDQQLYKFKEGNFVDLHLNDIEDMLLLAVQYKLFHLDGSVIVDFIVALRMFTRSLILKRRIKDLQLGLESYQKKLNITKPQKTFLEIEFKEPYTP
uniref:Uncharacterized protein n=1 Tax=Tanacetum cinerariifolium TaxID=118510 RepID=A0A699IA77_TANCI|nr:hypothetical protein [Tanacetum cinerariifolium]GEZ51450.1 hypothetical protein [Tanacetum cinerariifolium]